MATVNDPIFPSAAFPSDLFKRQILNTMHMGLPEDDDLKPTFCWNVQYVNEVVDSAGHPYSWAEDPERTIRRAPVQVDCAVKFVSRTSLGGGTALGDMDTSRAEITLLDEQYQQIKDFDYVLLGENTYEPDFTAPPVGMFDVMVWKIFCSAVDESGDATE